jgi:hypothetical protein
MSPVLDTDTHEHSDFKLKVASMRTLIDAPAPADDRTEKLKAELTQRANELAQATGWTRDEFLKHAGCSSAQLVIEGKAKIDFMLACLSYLMWMESFLNVLDLEPDRQTAVIESTRLFRDGGRELADCKRVMGEKLSPTDVNAEQLISFGEVTRGFQVALAHTDSKSGRDMRRVLLDDPCYLSSPHIRENRVQLAWNDPGALGIGVAKAVRKHVGKCPACAAGRTGSPA